MVWTIIITGILTLILIGATIDLFVDGAIGEGLLMAVFSIVPGCVFYFAMSAAINGNLTKVEYRFPAKDFKLTTEIVVNEREATINGEQVFIIERDTTYVIEGLTPTFGDNTYENNTRELKRKELKTELK